MDQQKHDIFQQNWLKKKLKIPLFTFTQLAILFKLIICLSNDSCIKFKLECKNTFLNFFIWIKKFVNFMRQVTIIIFLNCNVTLLWTKWVSVSYWKTFVWFVSQIYAKQNHLKKILKLFVKYCWLYFKPICTFYNFCGVVNM